MFLASRPDLTEDILLRTKNLMNKHAGDCLINDYQDLITCLEFTDANDRHVLAAAIQGGTSLILTYNLKDFPSKALDKYQICAQEPDNFILGHLEDNHKSILEAVRLHRASLKNPSKKTVGEYLSTLKKQGLGKTVAKLEKYSELI